MSNVINFGGSKNYPVSNDAAGDVTVVDITSISGYSAGSRLLVKALKLTTSSADAVELNLKEQDGALEYRQFFTRDTPIIIDFGPGWLLTSDKSFQVNKGSSYPMLGTVVAELVSA